MQQARSCPHGCRGWLPLKPLPADPCKGWRSTDGCTAAAEPLLLWVVPAGAQCTAELEADVQLSSTVVLVGFYMASQLLLRMGCDHVSYSLDVLV